MYLLYLSAIVQRIARSGLFPSRGEVQDVAPSVRPKAIHFPGFDLRLGLDTGILSSVNFWSRIFGAPCSKRTPTKNQQKINRNQHFINTLSTLHQPNVNFCSTSTKNKPIVSQKLMESKQLVNTSIFHQPFSQQNINTLSAWYCSALGLQPNINDRSTSFNEGWDFKLASNPQVGSPLTTFTQDCVRLGPTLA